MSSDASAAAASPMTNGALPEAGHREADASTNPAKVSSPSSHTLAQVCADLYARLQAFWDAASEDALTRRTQEQARRSFEVIEKALQDYEFDTLSLSYNGGKDCLVLLVIYLAALHKHFSQESHSGNEWPKLLPSIYAKPPDPFPSVTSFVESSSREYCLDLVHISTNPGKHRNPKKARSHTSPPPPEKREKETTDTVVASLTDESKQEPSEQEKVVTFRDAFAYYLDTHPQVQAIFVGTRRTDPHGGHLTHFDMTDGNWPRFMRIHPIIDWHLDEIWAFLRSPYLADRKNGKSCLDYCTMYDQGYTSLGGVNDTLRNPKLRYTNSETGEEEYRPAYALTADGEERLGRE